MVRGENDQKSSLSMRKSTTGKSKCNWGDENREAETEDDKKSSNAATAVEVFLEINGNHSSAKSSINKLTIMNNLNNAKHLSLTTLSAKSGSGKTTTVCSNESTLNSGNDQDDSNDQLQQGPRWENLPSVILLEIFSYLSRQSRIQASQVCRHWRHTLFHPSFWKKINFNLVDDETVAWSRCLSNWFKFSAQEVTLRCESSNQFVKEALLILKKLSNDRNLRKLLLEPTRCLFEHPTPEINGKKLMNLLLNIIETASCLNTLSLGCVEELSEDPNAILESLKTHQASNLRHLSLASVKDDPDHYDFLEVDCTMFQSFEKLTILTIDYDHVSDDLLNSLTSGIMERLVIHIHGWNAEYLGASDESWKSFTQKNPLCELRLNLIHSYNAVQVLHTHILKPSMPLTHLKVLFCESLNMMALNNLPTWYSETLQSLVWIDSMTTKSVSLHTLPEYDNFQTPDPLVLAAWRCKKLSEIVFIGSKYTAENLLAIVRLRHDNLKRLEFAEKDIMLEDSYSERVEIIDEIQEVLGERWNLISDKDLPSVVVNPLQSDSREVIMPMVLQDQK